MVSKEIINNNKVHKGICVLKWKRFHFYVLLFFSVTIIYFNFWDDVGLVFAHY